MIKIDLVITSNQSSLCFFTDEKSNFVMSSDDNDSMIIMENAGCEFDGICDKRGILHFLIQDNNGTLFYIRYDNKIWKKYNLLSSKEKKNSISHIHLLSSGNSLCAFYVMEHQGKFMLIKHMFSPDNLRITPSVIDLVDFRKDFCICTHPDGSTHLYYRNAGGKRRETIFDKYFSISSSVDLYDNDDTYVMKVVNSGASVICASICARKNHTALIFKKDDTEKIITFAIARNAQLSMCAKNDLIDIYWQEGNFIMHSESKNGGKDFSKPKFFKSEKGFFKYKKTGDMPGLYKSEYICKNDIDSKPSSERYLTNQNKYIKKGVNTILKNDIYHDMDSSQFLQKISQIEKDVERIGIGVDKICIFLDRLVQFKKDTENPMRSFSVPDKNNIGVKNEDNIKLFENMSIDDAIKDNSDKMIFMGKETENEHTV
ncbi:MAG: hypothetical protein E7394_07315 [Ruminococcaceae bacterium]|nr:hypothetical protein [Oscillospiraceae bacterium]